MATELAKSFDVWVLTRASNRSAIESELTRHDPGRLRFVYFDLPVLARRAKRRTPGGTQFYYMAWQRASLRIGQRLHRQVGFAAAQHITWGRYWMPGALYQIGIPYVWGPVGGGDSVPRSFLGTLGAHGRALNGIREAGRRLGERLPSVRRSANGAHIAIATTPETERRLRALGARRTLVLPAVALPDEDLRKLERLSLDPTGPFRLISIGVLKHWKGFELGIRAFAAAGLEEAEYWIVGQGPEGRRLQKLTTSLGIAGKVQFLGRMSREETLRHLGESHVLVHPSLHDSGGWVCLEAMAAGRPVVHLDLGGPAVLVSRDSGLAVSATDPATTVNELAAAIRLLARRPDIRRRLGLAGRRDVATNHTWSVRGAQLRAILATACGPSDSRSGAAPSTVGGP